MSRAIQSILSYNTSSYRWFYKSLSRTMKTNKIKLESTETTLKKAFRMLSSLVKMAGSKPRRGQKVGRYHAIGNPLI